MVESARRRHAEIKGLKQVEKVEENEYTFTP
jgi:hypothetical protein